MKNTKKKKSKKKISKVVFNKVAKVASLATTVVAGEMIATKNAEANVTIGSTSGSSVTATGASLIGSGNLEGIAIGKSSKVSGAYGIAMGKDSTSVQEGAIAIGKDSNALNKSAVALGYNSKASGGQSVAIGGNIQTDRGAQATGDQSISIGGDTVASGSSSIAIGGDDLDAANRTVGSLYSSLTGAPLVGTGTDRWIQTKASGEASIAVGVQATSAGDLATAFGTKTKASGKFSTALGVGATSDGQGSIAIGGAASSVGATAIAIGTKVTTIGESASAIGYGSQANNKGSIAIGLNSKSGNTGSTEENTIAMGTNSQSLTANSVAIGTGSIGGSTGIGSSAVAIGNGASAKGSDGIALGSGSNANNMQNIAIGYKTETGKTQVAGSSNNTDIRNVSIGSEAGKGMGGKDNLFLGTSSGQTSNGDYNVAFGSGSGKSVTGSYNTAMGANAGIGVKNNNNVSIGADSGQNTDGLGNTAIGWQSGQAVKGNQNISMGYQSAKGLKGSSNTVIGNQAGIGGVEGDNNIIVGTNATRLYTTGGSLKVQNVVSLGTNSKAYTDNSMSIGSYSEATGKAAIAIGQGSKASKDNSMAIGNGTLANTANGDVALGSGSATKAVTAVSNATITPPSSKSITYGTFAGNNPKSAVSVGTAGNERQIQNVAAGRVTKDSTDAINGSQLFAVANELGKTWKGNAGKTGSGDLIGSATSTQVMPGDEVQFIAGDNLSIKQETSTGTQKYTYSLKKDVDLGPNGSLKAGPVTINNNGINAGNKTITNVSPGVNPTDAANVSQVKAAKTEVKSTDNTVTVTSSTDHTKGNTIYDLSVDAANKNLSNINNAGKGVISDIATKSINVAAGTNVKDVTSNTVTNADGTKTTTFTVNAKGANVVAGDGVTVTSSAGANNVTDYTVAVKDTTLTTNGTTVTAGNNNNFAKAGDVANAITNAANAAKTEVKSPDSSINVTADNTSPDGHTIYNITVDKTGKVAAGDTKLVTGDTVNTAINKAVSNPLTFAGDNAGGDVTRKLGEKLNIKGGATGATAANNIKVTADGTDTLNIELAKDLTGLDSIVTNGGNTTINNNGITTPTVTADKVTINNAPTAGTDATNKTYVDSTKTEVTSNDNSVVVSKSTNGNKDVYDLSVDITKLDAANKDLSNITNAGKGVINNIARNSVDVVAGTNIAGVTTSTSTNTDGTMKTTFTVDAKGANVVAGDGVTVTSAAGTNNVTDYTVAVKNTSLTTSGTTVSTTDPNSYVKAGDLATAITNVGKAAKTEVKSSDNSIGVTSSAGTDGNTIYDLKVDTSGTVTPGNNKLVTGDTVNTAINNAKTDLINNNPLTFAGDSGTDVTRKLGEKLNVKGGATGATTTGNIAVKADGTDTLNIELAKDLTGLDSITTNGGTKIDNNGITINNGAGSPVTLGPTGLNNGGNPITGVGAGTNKTDAVNVGQLDDKIANSKWQLTTSKSTGTVNGTTVEDINPNEVVTIDAGKNIGITQSGNKITIDTDFTSVANAIGGGTTVDPTTGAINTTGANIGGTGKTNVSDAVAAAKTTVTSADKSVTVVETTGTDGHSNYDLKVDTASIAKNTNLTYKANGANNQTTTLSDGLDFQDGKNTVASVDANGKVVYDIKDNIDLGTTGSVTAGNTTINNGGVTTPTLTLTNSTPINSSTGGKATVPTGNGNQAVTAQTVADAINALGNNTINLKAADGTVTGKQNLNKDGGLEFEITGSNGISTTATGNKVDVTIAQSGLTTTTSPTGAAVVTPTTGGNTYATAGDVANAIQNAVNSSGWNVVADKTGTGTTSGTVANELIKPGDTVKLQAGNNLNVDQTGGTFTYSLKDDISLNSVTTGDTKISNGGVTITNPAGSNVTLGPTGLNNGGNTITNVGAGKNGTDAVNVDQLTKATGASKTELANGTNTNVTSSTGTNGQTIYKVNADKSEVATTGTGLTLTPTTTTDTDGTKTTTYTLGLDTTTLTTGANGSVTAPSTADAGKVVTAGSVADAINKSGFTLKSSANGGTLGSSTGDEVINPGDVIDMAAGKNLKVEQAANGKITYSLLDDININSVTAGNNKFDKTGLTISDGAGNTTVTTPSGTTYTSSTGDTTKVGPNGITINNGAAGNPVSLTKNGLDNGGNTITNVAPGVNGTDAVNVTQLKNTVNNAVNNGPVVYTNAAGDKVVKANDGNYYKASDVDANGNPLPGAVAVNPTDINHSLLNADGTTTNPSKLTNIADGLISPTSKDAINGSQLYKNATSVSNIIGGNSVVNPDGTLTTSNIGNTGKNTVHDAIGYLNQGFNVTTSASNGTVSGTSVEAVKAGETVTIDAGKNIAVTQNGKTISIATKDDLSVSSVTATDPAGNTTVLNPTGTTITDVAGNSNVSTATSNKLTDAAGNSNVATAAGNTYTSATGDITNVGSNGITITSGGTTVSLTNAGLNNGGNKITNVAAGVAPTDAVNVSQLDTAVNNLNTTIGAAKTEVVAGTNTTVTSTQGANKQTIYKIDADGTTVSGGSSFVSVTPGTKDANNITDYKVDLSQSTKDTLNSIGTGNIAAGDNNTVTGSTVHNYLQNNPLTYTDDNGTTLTRNLGQNLNVVGRATGPLTTGNIGVAASGTDTLEVKLAENVNLGPNGSVTMGNTVVNNDGVTINGGPSITSNGIDGGGKKLTNVAEGDITPTSRDVVTGGQVYNAVIAGTADKATRAELVGVNDNLTAGIAGVAAMANLPQINDAAANRFNVAVAGGAYKNGRAMALGFSGISDGGRFIYKASASLNNKNDVTVGLGMGYQFGKRDVEPNELDRLKSMVTLLEQQKDSYSRQLKKQLEEEASKNRENSELIKQLMQEVQELKNRR